MWAGFRPSLAWREVFRHPGRSRVLWLQRPTHCHQRRDGYSPSYTLRRPGFLFRKSSYHGRTVDWSGASAGPRKPRGHGFKSRPRDSTFRTFVIFSRRELCLNLRTALSFFNKTDNNGGNFNNSSRSMTATPNKSPSVIVRGTYARSPR